MLRRAAAPRLMGLATLIAIVLVLPAACVTVREFPSSSRSGPRLRAAPRAAMQPANDTWYALVGSHEVDIQRSTKRLASLVTPRPHLRIDPLSSANGTVAIAFIEISHPKEKWGAIMTPAERQAFGAFAADRSMGQWLIVFTDVVVKGGVDPIPLTGYRWRRADVEAYAKCGIPSSGLDSCTRAFYALPQMVLIPPTGTGSRGG